MSSIWIVSEVDSLSETLAFGLRSLGDVARGGAARGEWRDASAPDLIVLCLADAAPDDHGALERALELLLHAPHPLRAPAAVLYVEPPSGLPSGALLQRLVDDRPLRVVRWPLSPDEIAQAALELLAGGARPPTLRERARRDWVTEEVELFYSGLDLPALRRAVDPRNAQRPILLLGEPGTARGALASYVHQLAEPARHELVAVSAADLQPGECESRLLAARHGRRVTLYLADVDLAPLGVQVELGHVLAAGGALGVESLRWIASARRESGLAPALRGVAWLRVELAALRDRPDRRDLIAAWLRRFADRTGRHVELDDEARAVLDRYAWPGNLRELDRVLEASLGAARGDVVRASELALGTGPVPSVVAEPEGGDADSLQEATVLPEPDAAREVKIEEPTPPAAASGLPGVREILPSLAQEVRQPLLAIRAYAHLLDQRPDDAGVRRELASLVGEDLAALEQILGHLEHFAGLGDPDPGPVMLSSLVASELAQRQEEMRKRSLVVLRELEHDAPPAHADESQLRFALGILLDRATRMVPPGGDLYVGCLYRPAESGQPARHRMLIRFHSPEEVLVGPEDGPGPTQPLEVVMARAVIERAGGLFAVDASGAQDNLILIELGA